MKVASVIGLEFPVELLHRIYNKSMESNLPIHIMLEEIERACYAEFIHQDVRNPRIFIFNNAYFQRVAYSRLLFSQRTKLHREIAIHYELVVKSNSSLDMGVLYPVLHNHWNCILSASIAEECVNQEALSKTILYLKLIAENSELDSEDGILKLKEALEKTKLIADKEEKIKRQKELKLKIIGTAQKTLFTQFSSNQKKKRKAEIL